MTSPGYLRLRLRYLVLIDANQHQRTSAPPGMYTLALVA